MSHKKKTIGIRAVASALLRILLPSAAIRESYLNPDHGHRLQGLVKKVNNCEQMTRVMQNDNFKGVRLYCVAKFLFELRLKVLLSTSVLPLLQTIQSGKGSGGCCPVSCDR